MSSTNCRSLQIKINFALSIHRLTFSKFFLLLFPTLGRVSIIICTPYICSCSKCRTMLRCQPFTRDFAEGCDRNYFLHHISRALCNITPLCPTSYVFSITGISCRNNNIRQTLHLAESDYNFFSMSLFLRVKL